MIIRGRTVSTATLIGLAAIAAMVLAAMLIPGCVSKWRSERAQARVDASQAGAAALSAGDAINAVASSGAREGASEDMTRANDRDIRNAPGADQRVDMGVHSAGLAAICKRAAYRDDPKCAVFRK